MISYWWGNKIILNIIYLFIYHVTVTFYKHCLSLSLTALNLGVFLSVVNSFLNINDAHTRNRIENINIIRTIKHS